MAKPNRKSSLRTRLLSRNLLLTGIGLLIVAGGVVALTNLKDDTPSSQDVSVTKPEESFINLNPPTKEEKAEAETRKDEIVKQSGNQSSPPMTANGKKSVTPIITSADENSVRAYVPAIVEDGGTCTATLTRSGSTNITASSVALSNVSQTVCAVDLSEKNIPAGEWTVYLSYISVKSEGKSQPTKIVVP